MKPADQIDALAARAVADLDRVVARHRRACSDAAQAWRTPSPSPTDTGPRPFRATDTRDVERTIHNTDARDESDGRTGRHDEARRPLLDPAAVAALNAVRPSADG